MQETPLDMHALRATASSRRVAPSDPPARPSPTDTTATAGSDDGSAAVHHVHLQLSPPTHPAIQRARSARPLSGKAAPPVADSPACYVVAGGGGTAPASTAALAGGPTSGESKQLEAPDEIESSVPPAPLLRSVGAGGSGGSLVRRQSSFGRVALRRAAARGAPTHECDRVRDPPPPYATANSTELTTSAPGSGRSWVQRERPRRRFQRAPAPHPAHNATAGERSSMCDGAASEPAASSEAEPVDEDDEGGPLTEEEDDEESTTDETVAATSPSASRSATEGEGDELGEEELEAERVEEQALAASAREGEHADAEELEPKFEAPVQLYV